MRPGGISSASVLYMNIFIKEDEFFTEVNDGINLIQKKDGLTFGTDALLLAAFTEKRKKGAYACEIGGGTGIVSFLCAERGNFSKIYCAEIQPEFADLIKRNAELNGFSNIVEPICADVRDLKLEREVDIVFSNPPYMKTGSGKENPAMIKNIARRELHGGIDDFCRAAARLLKYGGDFYVVYRPERLTDLICSMRNAGLEPKKLVIVSPDRDHDPCLILVSAKKGASSSIIIPKPLYLYENGVFTPQTQYIYDNGEFMRE